MTALVLLCDVVPLLVALQGVEQTKMRAVPISSFLRQEGRLLVGRSSTFGQHRGFYAQGKEDDAIRTTLSEGRECPVGRVWLRLLFTLGETVTREDAATEEQVIGISLAREGGMTNEKVT
jgi:hypothetical protein